MFLLIGVGVWKSVFGGGLAAAVPITAEATGDAWVRSASSCSYTRSHRAAPR